LGVLNLGLDQVRIKVDVLLELIEKVVFHLLLGQKDKFRHAHVVLELSPKISGVLLLLPARHKVKGNYRFIYGILF
jgi:hypothetical protein